ncbi:sensor domain-containing protein [Streptomyces triticirhizae]|uniref:Putative sensor domain-containing protein n=1 Tax=Streptomyces triticirhizae TaxID=2483353 RepID=A0A3M2LR12_9ACTN|nr:sensor domain-containing protein [Streptomyces triticirhizae]RMI39526.1 hypothetical protein EBN88_14570 [Streptomyces triticirhizae]
MATEVLERTTAHGDAGVVAGGGRGLAARDGERGAVSREGWGAATARAPWRGLGVALAGLFVSVPLFCLAVVSISLIPVGIGLFTTPVVFGWIASFADWRRSLVARWGGLPVPPARRDDWVRGAPAPARTLALLGDPASWRQLWWLLVDMTAGVVTALLPVGLISHGVWGYVLAAGVWEPIHDADGTHWYAFVPVNDQASANLAALTGTGFLLVGLLTAGVLLRGHLRLTRAVLGTA